nr:ABC transporter substrate-binding protein [Streptomyces sp. CLI2509]
MFLVAGVLAVPALASCSGDGGGTHAGRVVAPDVHQAARDRVAEGGTLHWAVDRLPSTLNTFQADADTTTARVASATLPSMFHLDRQGRPARSAAYLRDAKVETTEPRQVVVYHLDPKAAWNNGRDIGADDFAAQWQALRGSDSKYWTARNAGYDRIAKVERGANAQEVRVTFAKPYADWRALFSPLYPKEVMGSAETFNDAARTGLAVSAGPFRVGKEDRKSGDLTLERDTRWWGDRAKLDGLVLRAVPAGKRVKAMLDGRVDLAPVEQDEAARVARAGKGDGGPLAPQSGPNAAGAVAADVYSRAFAKGSPEQVNRLDRQNRADLAEARAVEEAQQRSLGRYRLRKSLEPAYTQLALNGESGPLSDERVRRAVARALDRKSLAQLVLKPLGLPADPVGSHLALAGQDAYADSSGALGKQDAVEAQALLSDAGYKPAPVSGEAAKKDEAAQGKAGADADGKAGTGARTDGKAPRTDAKAPEDEARSEKSGADAGKARTAGKKAGAEKKAGAGKKAKDAAAPLAPAPVPPQSVLLHQAYAMAARPAKAAGAAGAYAPRAPPRRRGRRRRARPRPRPVPPGSPPCSARTASPSRSASSSPRAPVPRNCARSARRSRAWSRRSASAPRCRRSPTPPTSRTTSRPATTTWRCGPGRAPPSPPPTRAPSTASPSRRRTARSTSTRTTRASAPTASTSSSTRPPGPSTPRRPGSSSRRRTPASGPPPVPSRSTSAPNSSPRAPTS